jgi:Phage capsid family
MVRIPALADARSCAEHHSTLKDFYLYAACKAAGISAEEAEARRLPSRVVDVLKGTVAGATTGNVGLTNYGVLAHIGFFDRILGDALRLPLMPGRIVIGSDIDASSVSEGAGKPIRAMALSASDLTPLKVATMVVLSKELFTGLTTAGVRFLERMLRRAVARGTDSAALTALGGTSFEANSTNTWDSILGDFQEVAHMVEIGADSRLYWVTTSRVMKAISRAATANGITTIGLQGGEIMGAPILLSDGAQADTLTLIDAAQIAVAVADPQIELRTSSQADVQMSDTPTQDAENPTASTLVSAFQANLQVLRCERTFGIKALGAHALATLTNITWTGGQDSPATL